MSEEAQSCRPNISPRGRRLRRRFGWVMMTVAGGGAMAMAWAHVAWPWRVGIFLPSMMAGFGFLQARRNTCVARAKEGTFERDDLSKTPAPETEVAESRRVAQTIRRDATLIGFAGAVLAVATAFVR
jgi:hypothetical protein